jgi:hypothetical protein
MMNDASDAGARRRARANAWTNVTSVSSNDTSFDDAFWHSISPSERMELTWEMFLEGCRWQGLDGSKLRLQRSIACLQLRRR